MFASENLYNDIDTYNSGNRLFNLNDSQNIWSSDKLCPVDNNFFIKNRNVFNNIQSSDRFNRTNRKPPGNRTETNLIVNYLPDGFYEDELLALFSGAGKIVHHHVVRNKDNRSECYGFVDYEKPSDAEKAIEMFHQYQIQNKKLKVQNAHEGLQIKEEEKLRAIKGKNNIGYNVEIRNAPIRWSINDVKNIFGKYGEILKVTETIPDETVTESLNNDIKTKTFNVVFRYYVIAAKVVRKKTNQLAEPMWPLALELSIVSEESVPSDAIRNSRTRGKMRFDQMSEEGSWDNGNYYPKSYESPPFNWGENIDCQSSHMMIPLTSNGRPILKHKDNLMHLNGSSAVLYGSDNVDKWNSAVMSNESGNFFDSKLRTSCNDIKAIWEPKESILNEDISPRDIFVRTPLLPSRFRSGSDGGGDNKSKYKANIWFKMENMQPTGSFKLRGMAYWCYKAKLDGVKLVVSSSGGNAGLAAAYACRMLNIKCTVVVSHATRASIIGELLKENAEVIQEGANWKEAHMKAESIVANCPCISRLCHPFDSPLLWSGYESIVDEIIADMKGARLDMIVLAVGGGGLLNGIAQGITKNKLNKTTAILAMETEGASCLNQSLSVNHIVSIIPDSIATSLGAPSISQRTWEIYCNKEFHLFSKICSDGEAIDACCQFLNEQNCLVEPACGASLSALYNGTLDQMAECRECDLNIVVLVCGGRCIDVNALIEMKQYFAAINPNTVPHEVINYDNLAVPFEVTDRFLSMNINKDTPPLYQPTPLEPDVYYPSQPSSSTTTTTLIHRFDPSIPSYNHMFPSLTKTTSEQPSNTSTNCAPIHHKSNNSNNILTENKFLGYRHRNSNYNQQLQHPHENMSSGSSNNYTNYHHTGHHQHLHHHQSSTSISTGTGNSNNIIINNDQNYMSSNDLMSSPVGSQHSDKENRMLPN